MATQTPKIIAVNTRMLISDRLDGIGNFAHETLSRLVEAHPDVQFLFYSDRPLARAFQYGPNVTTHTLYPPARHPLLYPLWFDWLVAQRLKKDKPDLFLSPDGLTSRAIKTPQLPVIHDINFEHHPEYMPFWYRWYYRTRMPRSARLATRIATISEYSRQDIARSYDVDQHKIDIVYNGVAERYHPISSEAKAETQTQYSEGQPYFLFVGSLHPRKNLGTLLQAFDQYKQSHQTDHKLVIVGASFWGADALQRIHSAMTHKDDVVFTGRVDDDTLVKLYGAATALTFVPLFEGFGVPMIEAMNAGTPVLAADVTSLPEIAGDAALYVDPTDIQAIAKNMHALASDETLRDTYIKKGLARAQAFSWDQTAELLWQSIERAIATPETEPSR